MSSYNKFERYIAKFLEKNPKLKLFVKRSYQFIQYKLKSGGPRCVSNSDVLRVSTAELPSFFGYYDKSCWNPSSSYVAYHKVLDKKAVICIRCSSTKIEQEIDVSDCWNWQQGSMITWIDDHHLVYNGKNGNKLGCYIYSILTGKKDFIIYPIQALSKDKESMASINYLRLTKMRPDYGYNIECENYSSELSLGDDGINIFSFANKKVSYFLSLKTIVEFSTENSMKNATHKLNHLSYSPDSKKIAFMHRWFDSGYKRTRLLILDLNTKELCCVFNNVMFSHYDWVSNECIFAWCRGSNGDGYYMISTSKPSSIPTELFEVEGLAINANGDGHPSVSPDGRFIITDTYPAKDRMQSLILIDLEEKSAKTLAKVFSPWKYQGLERCDLHHRWSPCSKYVAFDSTHEDVRGLYKVNVC